ncbi:uncharacterized protein B0T15DRAFT_524213 [Chaetomium strumarium]|uniref:Cyanovirin-N domain-containing protein n=1 Tax=Chaetomium strumarium TaxID=1170767 RepID=A0AAJ0GY67_9PEZI|nr:hypothetical protein B0T15DRAFT_524213 [Chaetomium strumarium]
MKCIPPALIITLWLTATAAGARAANFVASCDKDSIKVSGTTLTANCKTIFGQSRCSRLDLNRCLRNSYGTLQADPTGAGPHLRDQCIQCSNGKDGGFNVDGGPALIHCQCNPGTGAAQVNWPTAFFDTSQ